MLLSPSVRSSDKARTTRKICPTKRSLDNHPSLMEALKRWLPEKKGFRLDSFIPGLEDSMNVWDIGDRVYQSCLVIGPHGGNMPNMMFLRQGCWVVEIGYDDAIYPLPSDFYYFTRNLGLKYWLSVGGVVENGMLEVDFSMLEVDSVVSGPTFMSRMGLGRLPPRSSAAGSM